MLLITTVTRSNQFFQRYKPHRAKMLKNHSKSSWFGSRGGKLLKYQKFNQFFLVHRYVCGKVFTKIESLSFI